MVCSSLSRFNEMANVRSWHFKTLKWILVVLIAAQVILTICHLMWFMVQTSKITPLNVTLSRRDRKSYSKHLREFPIDASILRVFLYAAALLGIFTELYWLCLSFAVINIILSLVCILSSLAFKGSLELITGLLAGIFTLLVRSYVGETL